GQCVEDRTTQLNDRRIDAHSDAAKRLFPARQLSEIVFRVHAEAVTALLIDVRLQINEVKLTCLISSTGQRRGCNGNCNCETAVHLELTQKGAARNWVRRLKVLPLTAVLGRAQIRKSLVRSQPSGRETYRPDCIPVRWHQGPFRRRSPPIAALPNR